MKKKTILSNGLTIVTQKEENAVSTMLCYWVKAGGNHEANYPYGTAHFLEHMMFKGTKSRDKNQIVESIDEIGGRFNASTFTDKTRYYNIVPFDAWKVGADVLTDMLFHSTFPLEEMEKEKKVVLEEISRSYDDPTAYASRVMMKHLRELHEERASVLGTDESVTSITQKHLTDFVAEYYQPQNMVFVATGNINHEELVDFLESKVPQKEKKEIRTPAKFKTYELQNKTVHIERETKQAHLYWGLFGPDFHQKDAVVADVVANILGGGMSSRLFKKIREEKGMAYTTSAYSYMTDDEGFIIGYVGTDPKNLQEVKIIIQEELDRLKTELVDKTELLRVKNATSGRYLISQDDKSVVNSSIAIEEMFGVGSDPTEYANEVRSVTQAQIQAFAQRYFGKEKMIFVEVTPTKTKF